MCLLLSVSAQLAVVRTAMIRELRGVGGGYDNDNEVCAAYM